MNNRYICGNIPHSGKFIGTPTEHINIIGKWKIVVKHKKNPLKYNEKFRFLRG
jgi:hypothetical protein